MIVDDHQVVRAGFKQLLDAHPRIEVIAQASNCLDAFQGYKQEVPDVVLMDLSMPSDAETSEATTAQGGIEAVHRIIQFDPEAHIIVLSVWENSPYPSKLVEMGIKGYLTKRCAADELIEAVISVFNGQSYFTPAIKAHLEEAEEEQSPLDLLTKRELQVFTMLAEGFTATDIADSIYLSHKTVHAHRSNILRKLKASNNTELAHMAIRYGIIDA